MLLSYGLESLNDANYQTKVVGISTELQHNQSLTYLKIKQLQFFLALKFCLLCQSVAENGAKIKW